MPARGDHACSAGDPLGLVAELVAGNKNKVGMMMLSCSRLPVPEFIFPARYSGQVTLPSGAIPSTGIGNRSARGFCPWQTLSPYQCRRK